MPNIDTFWIALGVPTITILLVYVVILLRRISQTLNKISSNNDKGN